jgi:hypothetical protein
MAKIEAPLCVVSDLVVDEKKTVVTETSFELY